MTNTVLNTESSKSTRNNIRCSVSKVVHINYKLFQRLMGLTLIILTFIVLKVTGDVTLSFLMLPLGLLLLVSKKKLITTKGRKYIMYIG